jgi:hypothetical protein
MVPSIRKVGVTFFCLDVFNENPIKIKERKKIEVNKPIELKMFEIITNNNLLSFFYAMKKNKYTETKTDVV